MHPDLERLLDLQKRDLALAEVDARLKALLDEVASLDGELARARIVCDEYPFICWTMSSTRPRNSPAGNASLARPISAASAPV